MEQITLRIPEDTLDDVESRAEERGVTRSEYIRDTLVDGVSREEHADLQREHEELQREHAALRDRLEAVEQERDDLETEVERLKNEKRLILEDREEKKELARYVERERNLSERKAQAGIIKRTKWWFTGMPENGQETAADSK